MGRSRRCSECGQPLYPHEQGSLCSPCFYDAICTPGPADTGDAEAEPGRTEESALDGRREPTRLTGLRSRRGF